MCPPITEVSAYFLVCRVTVDHEGARETKVTLGDQEDQGLVENLDSLDSLEYKEDRCAHTHLSAPYIRVPIKFYGVSYRQYSCV